MSNEKNFCGAVFEFGNLVLHVLELVL